MAHKSLELLDKILIGTQITANDIDDLLKDQVGEDLYLEYKHGNELKKSNASDTIRQYVGAFSNSAGGVLIIGIDAPNSIPQTVTGCVGHSKGNLADWAADCLTPISNYLTPPPRFQSLTHSAGEILIIGVPRSIGLVPYMHAGRILYCLRLHDQTLIAPEYLIADLLMGRRQQPSFDVVTCRAVNLRRSPDGRAVEMNLGFDLRLAFENTGLVWADDSKWGIIAWTQEMSIRSSLEISPPSSNLLTYVDVHCLSDQQHDRSRQLIHFRSAANIEKPFETCERVVYLTTPLRIGTKWFEYTWKAAAYLVAKNSLPTWYQVSLAVGIGIVKLIDDRPAIESNQPRVTVTKVHNERPIVAWDGI